jgi:UDP-N-acetylmuramoyl-tripeptide--D-alanyl-D-alanine ligase
VRSNPLSYNTDVGLAFAVLETGFDARRPLTVVAGLLRALWNSLFLPRADVLVLELGARRAGDMRDLLRVVQPQIAVITELGPSYSEDQAGLAVMRQEMKELVEFMERRSGTLVVCADDAALAEMAAPARASHFGREALVRDGGAARLNVDGVSYPLAREVIGDGGLYALAAAVLVARRLGVPEEEIRCFLA